MSEKILFQKNRLTVSETKIIVGNATIFYPSVTATSIYEGRPLIGMGFAGIAGVVIFGFSSLVFGRILGPHFPLAPILIMLIPMVGMAIAGFTYKVRCLFLGAGGGSVAILKSKDRSELEAAQRAIEEGKRAFEASGKKL